MGDIAGECAKEGLQYPCYNTSYTFWSWGYLIAGCISRDIHQWISILIITSVTTKPNHCETSTVTSPRFQGNIPPATRPQTPPRWAAKWIGANFPVCCRRSILSARWSWIFADLHATSNIIQLPTTNVSVRSVDGSIYFLSPWWRWKPQGCFKENGHWAQTHPRHHQQPQQGGHLKGIVAWWIDHAHSPLAKLGDPNSSCNIRNHVRDACFTHWNWFRTNPKPRSTRRSIR